MKPRAWMPAIALTLFGPGPVIAADSGSSEKLRFLEKLDRGLVAVQQAEGRVFLSWRLLASDSEGTAFNVYRETAAAAVKLNSEPLTAGTWWLDGNPRLDRQTSYSVAAVVNGVEQPRSAPFGFAADAPALPYHSIRLQTPAGYTPNDASLGDLDGDGQYEIVLHQTGVGKDNSQAGTTDAPVFQAYKLDGTLLWTINLGTNIREGAHYTQFLVYDFDGDGRAELVCKTADGTVDGAGQGHRRCRRTGSAETAANPVGHWCAPRRTSLSASFSRGPST